MNQQPMPTNGALVQFKRFDEDEWKQGEYDEENRLFIEIYAAETITHNINDIEKWENLEDIGEG